MHILFSRVVLVTLLSCLGVSPGFSQQSVKVYQRAGQQFSYKSQEVNSQLIKELSQYFDSNQQTGGTIHSSNQLFDSDSYKQLSQLAQSDKLIIKEMAELVAISRSFQHFSRTAYADVWGNSRARQTGNSNPTLSANSFVSGGEQTILANIGFGGYDCYSMSYTLYDFIKFLQKQRLIRYLRFHDHHQQIFGLSYDHVAVPVKSKHDSERDYVIDAWHSSGLAFPKIFLKDSFIRDIRNKRTSTINIKSGAPM